MKQFYAADLHTQTEITDFFMVKSAGIKVGSNKKQYFDVLLGDKTGEVNSKKWDISEREAPVLAAIKEGDIIKVRAQVTGLAGADPAAHRTDPHEQPGGRPGRFRLHQNRAGAF